MPVPKYSFYTTKATIPSGSGRLWFDKNDTQLAQSNLTSCYCHNNKFTLAENVFVLLCLKNVVWIMLHVQVSFFFWMILWFDYSASRISQILYFLSKVLCSGDIVYPFKAKNFCFLGSLLSILCTIVQNTCTILFSSWFFHLISLLQQFPQKILFS